MGKTALIAMSGGVDSSVAAFLVKKEGYKCIGANMRLYDKPGGSIMADADDANNVCCKLGIDFHVFDLREDFKKNVIDKFICAYENCSTPNPCIDCNKHMKFGKFIELADNLSCDYIVTGHYARIEYENGRYLLKKAIDHLKDQTYFLYCLNQQQLSRTIFPLGNLTKDAIRQIATKEEFVNALSYLSNN